ncbi:MAG TPA: methyltransferase domain-containing protein [Alphaproteobacteria bacterium]|nr:methyltransferase domain-containing protein [Alphaproteobacteria bacterium]
MATQYPDDFVASIEWISGEGFLSPGGPAEVRALLEGVDLAGQRVLDIGCGLGAIDVLLVREHGAADVVGIDVEPQLVARAAATAKKAGLSDRVEIRLVTPGPLPFPDDSFDVVFSKDSIIHIPDKPTLYIDVLRVLRPGGWFVASDWLYGGGPVLSTAMRAWLELVHLDFVFETPANSAAILEAAGFEEVSLRDRNAWYRGEVRREIELVSGKNYDRLVGALGPEIAARRLLISTHKLPIVESGELRPSHLRARKPR